VPSVQERPDRQWLYPLLTIIALVGWGFISYSATALVDRAVTRLDPHWRDRLPVLHQGRCRESKPSELKGHKHDKVAKGPAGGVSRAGQARCMKNSTGRRETAAITRVAR
jgi:hypothetical protein